MYENIREEELKNKVGADWFKQFDTTVIMGDIDFTVFPKQVNFFGRTPLLWAEAKTGDYDVPTMFVQLILTIGKARTFDKTLPPAFLAAFDFKKIAFVDYINIQDIFYLNDFNWNVTPSNHNTKEFQLIKERIESILKSKTYVFDYQKDPKELKSFIKNNIAKASTKSKIKIDKNNFIPIYLRWLDVVKPIIDVNWDSLKDANIFDSDFYLADLFVDDKDTQDISDDSTTRDNLFVVYKNQGYKIAKEDIKQMFDATINIKLKDTYLQFWKLYKRPPIKEFQEYIIQRRDLLAPQDIRERKGAFFTPRPWVVLSQKYITDYLGENWQEEYYVWDCASGTGNLLVGLTNKYNIYASTLDQADVNVMNERIDHGAILLKNHVFQFDFLNDDFTKLPESLQEIISDKDKRKKLIIYINPPYAEAGNRHTIVGTGTHKESTTNKNKTHHKFISSIGRAGNELFAQFLSRIYIDIPDCKIAVFSKLKNVQSPNFKNFRDYFKPKLEKVFIVPANTFDNVKGRFPIGFFIWNTEIVEVFQNIEADIFLKNGEFGGTKMLNSPDDAIGFINDWIKSFKRISSKIDIIGQIGVARNDMQNKSLCYIAIVAGRGLDISFSTLIYDAIFLAVQSSISATWLNDRDPFFFPSDRWRVDIEFQSNCLAFALFDGQNRISSEEGINHWIPFTEQEVNAKERFASNFMTDFINGKLKIEDNTESHLFEEHTTELLYSTKPREFSKEATAVFDAGRELWKYYHSQPEVNVNASFYDIRAYFQGRNPKGRMNSRSDDENYMELIKELRNKLNFLADKIKPKIYEYGFLKQ